ncbi:unnamed protein product [Mytilus edulis]|uniref:ATP-dependent DNA helicase n=1 Tax=Mytilus edulis TaxID=6550 RepID=A0A8S3QYG0_MYTED|nr:unnamed protein product [Mytilus edulis]
MFFNTNKCVQVLCPTGNSAILIDGVTIHSFLKIPTRYKSKEMKAPDGSTGEILQKNCEGLKVLIVDERSLIGCTTLEYKLTQDHATWLQKFQWGYLLKSHGQSFIDDMDENSLFVFPTHNEEWLHNKTKILKANERNPIAKVDAISHGSHAKGVSSENAKKAYFRLFIYA